MIASKLESQKQQQLHLQGLIKSSYYSCIGLLRAEWYSSQTKKLICINYGTAFAVSPNLLLTCFHNIYHQKLSLTADRTIFIPNHNGYITHTTEKYHSKTGKYCEFIPLQKEVTLEKIPTFNQLCLITLQIPMKMKKYIQIGLFRFTQKQKCIIIGYPSREYDKNINICSVELKRAYQCGLIVHLQENIITYTTKTKIGMSGSPILSEINGQIVAVGIHTHSGNNELNRGICFDRKAFLKLNQFETILSQRFDFPLQLNIFEASLQIKDPSSFKGQLIPQQIVLRPTDLEDRLQQEMKITTDYTKRELSKKEQNLPAIRFSGEELSEAYQ